jgi:alpha-1,6-mannosyltransferase
MAVRGVPAILLAIGAALLATTAIGAVALETERHTALVLLSIAQGIFFVAAVFQVWRWQPAREISIRSTLFFVLGVAILLRAMPLLAIPHSTDIYRYIWDGRVQAEGINPYRYIPADPALEHLRDEGIFPKINRKDYARTIYPPTAQIIYLMATRLGETVTAMKLAMLVFEALTIWALLQLLAARGLPAPLVLAFAWHPLAIWEVAGSGHVDIAAAAFMMLAILAADRGRQGVAGAVLAFAAGAKFLPLVIAPALWRRGRWRMPAVFVVTGAALYMPYLSVGRDVFGFLGGYADEGGLRTGEGFLLSAIFGQIGLAGMAIPLFIACALVVLGALAWRAALRPTPERPDIGAAFALATAFTVLISPHHAWYFLWLIPFLCLVPSPAVLYLTLAAPALYRVGWPPGLLGAALLYLPFALLLAIENSRLITFKETFHERARA